MPDITMCTNKDCPLKEECWRFQAKPSQVQSYAKFEPVAGYIGPECEYFWEMDNEQEAK